MAVDRANTAKRVRVIESNTDYEEMQAGHIIPDADPPKNESARGGFGDRDGRNGFGTDSSDGATALSMNEDTESRAHTDGLQTQNQLSSRTPTARVGGAEDDDDLVADDDDIDDIDDIDVDEVDDLDLDDDDLDLDDDDLDLDLDDDDDLDEDLDEEEDDL